MRNVAVLVEYQKDAQLGTSQRGMLQWTRSFFFFGTGPQKSSREQHLSPLANRSSFHVSAIFAYEHLVVWLRYDNRSTRGEMLAKHTSLAIAVSARGQRKEPLNEGTGGFSPHGHPQRGGPIFTRGRTGRTTSQRREGILQKTFG